MRRIKDIEAIESDSFVPQAFKSSRDDMKVRSVFLSLPSSHSCRVFSLSLIEFTFLLQCCTVCPETAQTKSNIQSSTVCSDLRRFHQTLRCSVPPERQHAHKSHTRQQSSSVFLLLLVQMQKKDTHTHVIIENVSEGARIRFGWARGSFEKDRLQHVTADLQTFGTHCGESDKGQVPFGCSLDQTKPVFPSQIQTAQYNVGCVFHMLNLKHNQV